MMITNRTELADAVNLAYDAYLDKLDVLAMKWDIVPGSPRQVQDDSRTHAEAERAWAEFNTEQSSLNDQFSAFLLAHHKAKGDSDEAFAPLKRAEGA